MRYYFRKSEGMHIPEHDQIVYHSPGMMASIAAVQNCQCEDGVRRTVYATGEPDTFFSIPARVSVKGKTVAGYLTTDNGEWQFRAYRYRKNWRLIAAPECQCQARHCDCHSGQYGPRRAVVSALSDKRARCQYCAGEYGGALSGPLPLKVSETCEQRQAISDEYYGAMCGMTGVEYAAWITAQREEANNGES